MDSTMGSKLRHLRVQNNLTQAQLAERFGVTTSAVSSYESGTRQPTYETLIKYSRIFHVTTDYILGLDYNATLDVSDLNDEEMAAIIDIITVFRNSKKGR